MKVITLYLFNIGNRRYEYADKGEYICYYSGSPGQPMKFMGFWTYKNRK
jgi:hypothetical protein